MILKEIKRLLSDKKGVFGLTAIQAFFSIILGLALLTYIIIVIFGVLGGTTILSKSSATRVNETGAWLNGSGYPLAYSSTIAGFSNPAIVVIINATDNATIASGNYTLSGNTLRNATAVVWGDVWVTYTYKYYTDQQRQLDDIAGNTSGGIVGFFSNINPVYAILAVLVIILVLIVLVRVVSVRGASQETAAL